MFFIITIGCKTKDIISSDKNHFVETYKGVFFKNCLKRGFTNSLEIKSLLEEDKSYNSDFLINVYNNKVIDSFSKTIYNMIHKDSIKSIGKAEGSSGSKVFKYCICSFNSKELDSLALDAYLEHIKSQK